VTALRATAAFVFGAYESRDDLRGLGGYVAPPPIPTYLRVQRRLRIAQLTAVERAESRLAGVGP